MPVHAWRGQKKRSPRLQFLPFVFLQEKRDQYYISFLLCSNSLMMSDKAMGYSAGSIYERLSICL